MNYSEMYRLLELYLPHSCAFSLEEKFVLKSCFGRMKPKTQMATLDALAREYEAHQTAKKTLLSHN